MLEPAVTESICQACLIDGDPGTSESSVDERHTELEALSAPAAGQLGFDSGIDLISSTAL